jgi:hypothetical protein
MTCRRPYARRYDDISLVVWRGAATKSSQGSADAQTTVKKSSDTSILKVNATTEQPTTTAAAAAAVSSEAVSTSSPITPTSSASPNQDSQGHFVSEASTNLQTASSTPTPSSTLSSFSTPTGASGESNNPSNLYSAAQEFKNKNLLEKLQDLWYERSGTSEILALKESVNQASLEFDQASAKVTFARRHLDESLRDWERTSGQHLQLLQRRESWTPEDAQSFANLVGREITTRRALEQARHGLARAEETLSKRQLEYMNRMRRRYHEEQIWQDQWRVLGTYGTWSLIVLNSCVFLGSQYFLRMRENARMKAIEELIRENSVQIAAATLGSSGAATQSLQTATKITCETDQVDNDKLALFNDGEVEYQDEMLREEEAELVQMEKTRMKMAETEGASLKERLQLQWRNVQSSAGKSLQMLQSKSKLVLGQIQSRTAEIVASIPGIEEMPRSPSEVHVPSAIVGASISGVAVLVLIALVSPRSK